ncbi:16S rRNA (uracil(1498)-N(3))-methyltransferase [Rothia sp. AR01]|uniref:Ribosomal RNA small subunit methyltransferase E n=1 Tax=Rothia santali TaxID=2949643 RepID=A0A9X2HF86_9MICC|nr:16S rRNA (uracil(1498)-N(3))-methyltransferase [Rothia santali]MCP3424621.1 16S rRNA (uracil(1498)-N(3))-methyltransferase [Rothia santali]
MTHPIFYVDPEELAGLAPGDSYLLGGAEGHHAATVKRIAAGEGLDLVDGRGLRVAATAVAAVEGGLEVSVVGRPVREAGSGVVLVQALAKGDRDLMAVEMATELGVDGVVPWQAERSIVRWKGERAAKAHAKWERTASAAAKQARRAAVPEVYDLHSSAELPEAFDAGDRILVLHEDAELPLGEALRAQPLGAADRAGTVYLVVGPEGGIAPGELALLEGAGGVAVRLGRDVLRSSTAGAAALAVINAASGYWA